MKIERGKLEAERRQIEAEGKKLMETEITKRLFKESPKYASISPKVTEPKVIERDGTFIKYSNGVVYDKKWNFEWFTGPNCIAKCDDTGTLQKTKPKIFAIALLLHQNARPGDLR